MINKHYRCKWLSKTSVILSLALVVSMLSPLAKVQAAEAVKATSIEIGNPVTVLHIGDTYDLNADLYPETSKEKTYWKSSNTAIADVDQYGRFTAKKLGYVRITAYTKSGVKSSCKILVVSKYGVTGIQERVDRMLAAKNCRSIYIKSNEAKSYTINEGRYTSKNLYVQAPLGEVDNYGKFKKVTIVDVATGSFNEHAWGNSFVIKDDELSFNVAKDASVNSLSVVKKNSKLNLQVNGELGSLTVSAPSSELTIGGNGLINDVVVGEKATGSTLNLSVKVDIELKSDVEIVLTEEAKGSKVIIADDSVKATVVNNTGETVQVVNKETGVKEDVKSEVQEDDNKDSATTGGATGGVTGGSTGGSTTTDTTATVTGVSSGDTATYTLPNSKTINDIKSAVVTVDSNRDGKVETYTISSTTLSFLRQLLDAESTYRQLWAGITDYTVTQLTPSATIQGTSEPAKKIVTFDNNSYYVTLNSDGSLTISKVGGIKEYKISKSTDGKVLTIQSPNNSNFANYMSFTVTY